MIRLAMTVLGLACGLATTGPASAERVVLGCSKSEGKLADAAMTGATAVSARAAAAVGDTDQYADWFGPFSIARSETVRANFKSIVAELRADGLVIECLPAQDPDCGGRTYAYVTDDALHTIHLCPAFFGMPSMEDALAGQGTLENGTRDGTIIHETSHFAYTAHTADECYSRSVCHQMARDMARAIRNADSYQYFAEDVVLMQEAAPSKE